MSTNNKIWVFLSLLDAQKAVKDQGYKDGKYWAPFILLDGLDN